MGLNALLPLFSNPAILVINDLKKRPRGFASPGYPEFAIIGEIMLLSENIAHQSQIFVTFTDKEGKD